jgi:hypothetical protein
MFSCPPSGIAVIFVAVVVAVLFPPCPRSGVARTATLGKVDIVVAAITIAVIAAVKNIFFIFISNQLYHNIFKGSVSIFGDLLKQIIQIGNFVLITRVGG